MPPSEPQPRPPSARLESNFVTKNEVRFSMAERDLARGSGRSRFWFVT
jgi:hypothetical protein